MLKESVFFKTLRMVTLFAMVLACARLVVHRWENYLSVPYPIKDEIQFVNKFYFLQEHGWYESVVSGTSPVYHGLVFLVNIFISDPLVSMKLLNVLGLLGVIGIWVVYLIKELKISIRYRWLSILSVVYLTVVYNAFFSACNDSLFLFFISLGMFFLLKLLRENKFSTIILAGVGFAFALGTRELLAFYTPGIMIWLFVLFFFQKINKIQLASFFITLLTLTVFIYLPAILEKGRPVFHDKNEGIYPGYWQEKNYLQLLINREGMTREEVESFKENNPEILLPQTYFHGIFLNPSLTLKNTFRQLKLINYAAIWKLGLVYFLFFGLAIQAIWTKRFLSPEALVFLMFASYAFAFAILPITRVEFRWFILFPLFFLVVVMEKLDRWKDQKRIGESLIYFNFLVIGIVNSMLIGIW